MKWMYVCDVNWILLLLSNVHVCMLLSEEPHIVSAVGPTTSGKIWIEVGIIVFESQLLCNRLVSWWESRPPVRRRQGGTRTSVGSGWTSSGLPAASQSCRATSRHTCTPNFTNYSKREKWQRMVHSSKSGAVYIIRESRDMCFACSSYWYIHTVTLLFRDCLMIDSCI